MHRLCGARSPGVRSPFSLPAKGDVAVGVGVGGGVFG